MTPQPRGLRVVAMFEAAKGMLVLLAGFGVLVIVNHGTAQMADALVLHLHLNPAKGVPRVFVELMNDTSNRQLQALAAGALAYAVLRLAEAFGLWRARAWAEWLSVVSGTIYVPFELYELSRGVTMLRLGMLLVNLGIVAYMLFALWRARQTR